MGHAHLTWNGIGAAGRTVQAARSEYRPGQRFALHDHGFAELFWVESGRGRHLLSGLSHDQVLVPGSCLAVPPDLVHGFAADEVGFRLVNVAIPLPLWRAVRQRLDPWPWRRGVDGAWQLRHLGPAAVHRLAAWLPELTPMAHPLTIESFVLDLLRLVVSGPDNPSQLPDPVRQALAELVPAGDIPLELDPAAVAKRVGWSIDHLTRELRRTVGESATSLLNRVRLDHAERSLRLGTLPVTAVAYAAGFANQAHFYRLFTARFACTPAAYRRRCRGAMG
jgi:AraC-like DNA-binding protein/quercetin dioxygenase-like cupin family protein